MWWFFEKVKEKYKTFHLSMHMHIEKYNLPTDILFCGWLKFSRLNTKGHTQKKTLC